MSWAEADGTGWNWVGGGLSQVEVGAWFGNTQILQKTQSSIKVGKKWEEKRAGR